MLRINDGRILKAIVQIQKVPEWKLIREWIDKSLFDLLVNGSKIDDTIRSNKLSGGAIQLMEIQDTFDKASETIERMSESAKYV